MRRLLPYLGGAMVLIILIGSQVAVLWRAAEMSGRPANYLTWMILTGNVGAGIVGLSGAVFFFTLLERSVRAAILVPITLIAVLGLLLTAYATPIANAVIGPLTTAGKGTVNAIVHTDNTARYRYRHILVVSVIREDGKQVNAFSTGGVASGTVRLGLDSVGNTWLLEPRVSDTIRTQGHFFLLFSSSVALLSAGLTRYMRRSRTKP